MWPFEKEQDNFSSEKYVASEVEKLYEQFGTLVTTRGKGTDFDKFQFEADHCTINYHIYSYNNSATVTVVANFISSYEQKLARRERRKAQRKANRDLYQPKYEALTDRVEALGGSLTTKNKHVNITMPRRRHFGLISWELDYNPWDYYLLCSRVAELEQILDDRQAHAN